MRVAIMQPYFFPYLGYFSLIKHTDAFISMDAVQYIRKGWINRNRVLLPTDGWQYIIAPVQAHSRDTQIKDILVVEGDEWKNQIIRKLAHYKKRAPYYHSVIQLLEECFANSERHLSELNMFYLAKICAYLNISFSAQVYSKMNLTFDSEIEAPDEWALKISEAIGADTYINPPGGKCFFDKSKYDRAGIDLKFIELALLPYPQQQDMFVPGLSIIDVMMHNNPEQINSYLDRFTLS